MTLLVFDDFIFWYSKIFQTYIFPATDLFSGKWYLETTVQVLGDLIAPGLVIVSRSLQMDKVKKVYIYICTCVCVCMCVNRHVFMYTYVCMTCYICMLF